MATPLSFHTGLRGVPGFLRYITGSDGTARGTVIPAISIVDSDGNPANGSAANPATIVTGQLALLASTGSNNRGNLTAAPLVNGIIVKSSPSNAANVLIGGVGVTTTADGTGNGYILAPGEAASFGVSNASAIYAISTAAAVLSYEGN